MFLGCFNKLSLNTSNRTPASYKWRGTETVQEKNYSPIFCHAVYCAGYKYPLMIHLGNTYCTVAAVMFSHRMVWFLRMFILLWRLSCLIDSRHLLNALSKTWSQLLFSEQQHSTKSGSRKISMHRDSLKFAERRHFFAKAVCANEAAFWHFVPTVTKNGTFRQSDWTKRSRFLKKLQVYFL